MFNKKCLSYFLLYVFILIKNTISLNTNRNIPLVKVKQGWLRGEVLDLITGDGRYYSFKGIPYGRAPVDTLRFKTPRASLPWVGVRNATEHGSVCPQIDIFTGLYIPGNEDCLFLNVYTNNLKPAQPRAVMFFIHGGGFQSGSGNVDNYGPDFLVSNDIVLVTFNYRLGPLGFLCMDTKEVPGNAGLKDQVLALKWVNQNIAQFGGDPNNVTIFGQSAGGSSTALHVLSPMSRGLFQRAIAMSGVPISDWSNSFEPTRRTFLLGELLGCYTKDPAILLNFLQSLPTEKLLEKNSSILSFEEINYNLMKGYYFTVVTEKKFGPNQFMTEKAIELLKKGEVNEVDIMVGSTNGESVFKVNWFESVLIPLYKRYNEILVPNRVLYNALTEKVIKLSDKIRKYYFGDKLINVDIMEAFVRCFSDTAFYYDICRFNRIFPMLTTKHYVYEFSFFGERNINGVLGLEYGIHAASHLDDLQYLFDAKGAHLPADNYSRSFQMVQIFCKLFTNFAKFGNPTPDDSLGIIWREYNNETEFYMKINEPLAIGQHLNADVVNFWSGIDDEAGIPH